MFGDFCRKMEFQVLFLVPFLSLFSSAAAWINAHATFYGGSDAAGTMGKESLKLIGGWIQKVV